MSKSLYKTDGARVYGQGHSYNCTNIVTAKELCCKLNTYEATYQRNQQTEKKLDKINKDIIRLNMTISTLHEEIQQIRKGLEQ